MKKISIIWLLLAIFAVGCETISEVNEEASKIENDLLITAEDGEGDPPPGSDRPGGSGSGGNNS